MERSLPIMRYCYPGARMKWWFWFLGVVIVTNYAVCFLFECYRGKREQVHAKG